MKSEPSWNFTPGRSLNSHTVSPTGFHDSARPGLGFRFSSCMTSASKTWTAACRFGLSAWYCGSSELGSVFSPIFSSCAETVTLLNAVVAARIAAILPIMVMCPS